MEPAILRDDFWGDLANTFLLRPVYRKPQPQLGPVMQKLIRFTVDDPTKEDTISPILIDHATGKHVRREGGYEDADLDFALGFQTHLRGGQIDLLTHEVRRPETLVGKYLVGLNPEGRIFSFMWPVSSAEFVEEES